MDLVAITAADQLEHPELRSLFRLWKTKARNRHAPARSEIEVIELKRWLSHVMLIDLLPDTEDVRFRVIGTWIVEQVGRDDTGKTIAEIGLTERTLSIRDEYRRAAREKTAYRSCGIFFDHAGAKDHLIAERLILPLSDDGRSCNKILSAIYFLNPGF
ncbi:PAS domain-containing protein [Nisaea sp.]|uniref:PAS domain-containing protein n=1 Tax=Nisaea sp. TaxID=2024842 RepID=UPI003B522161